MLQEIWRDVTLSAIFLDALLVVNIHIEIRTMLLGEGQAFVIDHGGVLDRGDAGTNCVLDALRCVGMSFNAQSEVAGLIDRGL